jgi:hypothetical protein
MQGFIAEDNNYGVFPYGKQWMVIYHNQQLEVFKTQPQCRKFIKSHMVSLGTAPVEVQKPKKSARLKTGSKTTTPKDATKK